MKHTHNRRVIILSNLNSGYFEQAVFYIKTGSTCPEDILVSEANKIVKNFSEKYSAAPKKGKKFTALKRCAAILGFFMLCVVMLYIFL